MGKTRYLNTFERGMEVGVRHSVLVIMAMLLDFSALNSFPCVSRMRYHPKDIQST
jgi:hypothetical protein